ncbi:MotA/TolQ/ExbB proton channel family protein [Candidatus Riflebacteria bacterium]
MKNCLNYCHSGKTQEIGKMFLIGIFIFCFSIVAAIQLGGTVFAFFDLTSLLIVAGSIFSAVVATDSPTDFRLGFKAVLKRDFPINKSQAERGILVFELLYKVSIAAGVLGFLIGLMQLLSNLNKPALMGPSIVIALITVFYGTFFGFFLFFPIKKRLELKRFEQLRRAE